MTQHAKPAAETTLERIAALRAWSAECLMYSVRAEEDALHETLLALIDERPKLPQRSEHSHGDELVISLADKTGVKRSAAEIEYLTHAIQTTVAAYGFGYAGHCVGFGSAQRFYGTTLARQLLDEVMARLWAAHS